MSVSPSRPATRQVRRKISGVFLLNKPQGLSSNAALQKVRWLFRAEKAGHTGALDPLATGLLPICLGEATKFSHFLLDADKTYQTTISLGKKTSTGDKEGEVVTTMLIPELTEDTIQEVLNQFMGASLQIPPMYSALKKDGQPLYKLAREGIEIERPARAITIHRLKLLSFNEAEIRLEVSCSKGTYIRVLGEDIAVALGTVGHLSALHRLQTGQFVLNEAMTIEALEQMLEPEREALLLPAYASVDHLPKYQFLNGEELYFCRGNPVSVTAPIGQTLAFAGNRFLGLGEIDEQGRFHPKRLVNE